VNHRRSRSLTRCCVASFEKDLARSGAAVADGTTLVTMSGPETPPFVTLPPPFTRATFVIAFAKITGTLVVRANDFEIIDGNGDVSYPTSFVGSQAGRGLVEQSADRQGRRIHRDRYWQHCVGARGSHPVVTWEYTLEND
jgi:hypothetical protein